ncbi:6-pyruvoyl trahydropterin synthase family protein [Candidatus Magnetaquicoccus inordinatus]|uniref:6-pyruvoyl trahydropterin synthase family protein n=1 Tax=Candidatus Magnetaquicoccus inordinatus TaxID=2496818 RepID=UPI00102BC516|nr:6-carboxytetrahydropterin synthase [Candidatus Magnetaquicoccus inordinatus]
MKICRQFKFEAAHRLAFHDGRCQRMHGHSYRLELTFQGNVQKIHPNNPQSGFVVDFGRLEQIINNELIDRYLDHFVLEESVPELPYSSAEFLAAWIVAWCIRHLEGRTEMGNMRIATARLWETVHAWAEADRQDAETLFPIEPNAEERYC